MKNRVSFLVITSGTGRQRRFSISRNLLYGMFLLLFLLVCAGGLGAWKYSENLELNRKYLQLQAEKVQLDAVSRNLKEIKAEESSVRDLLGIENVSMKEDAE